MGELASLLLDLNPGESVTLSRPGDGRVLVLRVTQDTADQRTLEVTRRLAAVDLVAAVVDIASRELDTMRQAIRGGGHGGR